MDGLGQPGGEACRLRVEDGQEPQPWNSQDMNEREEWHPPEKGLSQGEGGKMEQEKDLEDVKEELKTEAYD